MSRKLKAQSMVRELELDGHYGPFYPKQFYDSVHISMFTLYFRLMTCLDPGLDWHGKSMETAVKGLE